MKKGIIALFFLLLAGCSSKLAYNNLDWLVSWYMDDYVELNNRQEAIFDKQLEQWISWHRSEELPKYIAHLQSVRHDLEANLLTEARLLTHYEKATEHWQRLRAEITPQLAQMANDLNEEQVVHLFAVLEKDNKETEASIEDYQALSKEEQLASRIDDLEEDMEERIGELTPEQKDIVEAFAPTFLSSRPLWLAYRRDLQQRARSLFASKAKNPDFIADLTALMLNPEQYRSDAFLAVWANNRQQHAKLASAIAKTLTDKQKRKLLEEIDDMIADLQDLLDD